MAVGIGDMEEALAPFRVAWRRPDPVAGGDQSCIQPVYTRVVEDHAACRGSAASILEPRKTTALAMFTNCGLSRNASLNRLPRPHRLGLDQATASRHLIAT